MSTTEPSSRLLPPCPRFFRTISPGPTPLGPRKDRETPSLNCHAPLLSAARASGPLVPLAHRAAGNYDCVPQRRNSHSKNPAAAADTASQLRQDRSLRADASSGPPARRWAAARVARGQQQGL
eukprot:scaffold2516_cov242-Pinguiococcus_pyrenoidosus.AAC.2